MNIRTSRVTVFGMLWVDPEPVLVILTITRIPVWPIRTGAETEEPRLFRQKLPSLKGND